MKKYPRYFLWKGKPEEDREVLYRYVEERHGKVYFYSRNGYTLRSTYSYNNLLSSGGFREIKENELALLL